jgi:hypothetical protein
MDGHLSRERAHVCEGNAATIDWSVNKVIAIAFPPGQTTLAARKISAP